MFEDGRISVNLVYDDCLEELLQVKNKREGDLYEQDNCYVFAFLWKMRMYH